MEKKGKISGWNDAKGFGFILPEDGSARVFFHYSALLTDQARPSNGDAVSYHEQVDSSGRVSAAHVRTKSKLEVQQKNLEKIKQKKTVEHIVGNKEKDANAFWLVFPFFACIVILALLKKLSLLIVATYAVISLLTILIYRADKIAAVNGDRRTAENTLHILSLFGGWPGALIAQRLLRHKSSKQSFRIMFWITVIANIFLLLYLQGHWPI